MLFLFIFYLKWLKHSYLSVHCNCAHRQCLLQEIPGSYIDAAAAQTPTAYLISAHCDYYTLIMPYTLFVLTEVKQRVLSCVSLFDTVQPVSGTLCASGNDALPCCHGALIITKGEPRFILPV